jgi:type IV secretory pathway component VirB8
MPLHRKSVVDLKPGQACAARVETAANYEELSSSMCLVNLSTILLITIIITVITVILIIIIIIIYIEPH